MSNKYCLKWSKEDRKEADWLASRIACGKLEYGRTTDRNKLVNKFAYPMASEIADSIWAFSRVELATVALSMFLLFLANWKSDDKDFLNKVHKYMDEQTRIWFDNPEKIIWTMPAPVKDRTWSIPAIDSAVIMSRCPGINGERAGRAMEKMLRRLVESCAQRKNLPHLYEDLCQQAWIEILTKIIPSYNPRLNGFAPYANMVLLRLLDRFIAKQQAVPIPKSTMENKHLTYDWGISMNDSDEAAYFIENATASEPDAIEKKALHEAQLNGRSFDEICKEIAEEMADPESPHMERWLYAKGITSPEHKPMTIKAVMKKFGIAERTAQKSIQIINESLEDNPKYNYVSRLIVRPLMEDD